MIKEDIDFLKLAEVKVCVSNVSVESLDEVKNKIKNFAPSDGWISFQSSSVKRIIDVKLDNIKEFILAGEFYNPNGTSLSIRYDGEKWNFFTFSESQDGEIVLKRSIKQLSKLSDNTYLNYDIYYKFDSELVYRPYCSAFTGFTEEKK
ncbi:MAG: hypothetical protein K6G09_05700 [Treponema sp.]|nr:hypothetical protein [Treponema sp.]